MALNSTLRSALTPAIRTSRVNQLDAELIDNELEHVLTEPFWAALAPICGTNWRPEFMSLLKLIILRFSLEKSSSYGARLENLRWVDGKTRKSLTRNQITAYSLLSVLPYYLRSRVRDYMLSSGWADYPRSANWQIFRSENGTRRGKYMKRRIWDLSERLEQLFGGLDLINFLLFLFNGQYRSLLERFLGISFLYHRLDLRRNVSFEFLNRQLVWESITEFVLFILPFINFKRIGLRMSDWRSRLKNWIRRVVNEEQVEAGTASETATSKKKEARFEKLSNEICPICVTKRIYRTKSGFNSSVIDPHDPVTFSSSISAANTNLTHQPDDRVQVAYQVDCCQGLYCYYCLVGEIITWRENHLDQRWICWRCGMQVTSINRWSGASSST